MTDELITIATYSEPMMAHIAQAKLEAEGIESFIADENTVATVWSYAIMTGGAKLQVRQNDAQQARQILRIPD